MEDSRSTWNFLSNHAHVLLVLARVGNSRVRDIAVQVGITERAVQRIIADLSEAGAITKERVGRRNRYVVNDRFMMRHPLEQTHCVGELLEALVPIGTETPPV